MSASTIASTESRVAAVGADRVIRIALTAIQLGLITLVVKQFELESKSLYSVLALASAGFVVHAVLPLQLRLPFFTLLSATATLLVLRLDAVWVFGIGGLLLLLCHLPLRMPLRLATVALVGVGLGLARAGVIPNPVPTAVWPVLGAMFMFRLALYLYSIKHHDTPTGFWQSLGYFFMLPNVCFPLFPIIDYKTYVNSYFDTGETAIYHRGIRWMARGLVHLVLYRVVYHYMVQDPSQVHDLGQLTAYVLSAFLLYLRVSGQFHLIVGLLHLFGFRLPETNRLYFLSSSFTDLWRRINIYWKDFMMKLVYYPSFFRLRKLGNTRAVFLATAFVMFLTWALHGYQWFWLLGSNPYTSVDALFWGLLGALVLWNIRGELRRKGAVVRQKVGWDARRAFGTVGVFFTMCLMWTLWNSESIRDFFRLLALGVNADATDIIVLGAIIGLGLLVAGRSWDKTNLAQPPKVLPLDHELRVAGMTCLGLGVALAAHQPKVQSMVSKPVGDVIQTLTSRKLNRRDQAMLLRGYYDKLNNADRPGSQVWELKTEQPKDWNDLDDTEAVIPRDDFLAEDMKPNTTVTYKRQPFRTNSFGMHDREYTLEKPANTIRIAIFGPSSVTGGGVPDSSVFPEILERLLNQRSSNGTRYEVLNFGYVAFSILQDALMYEKKGVDFHPDVVLLVHHPPDRIAISRHLNVVLKRKLPIPYPGLAKAIADAGVDSTMTVPTIYRRLGPVVDSIIQSAVARMDSIARSNGSTPALMLFRLPGDEDSDQRPALQEATELQWPVLDLMNPYGEGDELRYAHGSYDKHLNLAGHQLIAEKMYEELMRHRGELKLP